MIAFTILGEPASKSNQRIPRVVQSKAGKPYTMFIKSVKANGYEKDAALQIPAWARQMITGPVRVTLRIFYASERPDLDESVVLDVLQAKYKRVKGALVKVADDEYIEDKGERVLVSRGVIMNDRQVREKHVFHFIDRNNPRAEIEVEPMQPQQIPLPVPKVPSAKELDDARRGNGLRRIRA